MAIDRRAALGLMAGAFAASLAPRASAATRRTYLGCRALPEGGYAATGFSASGAPAFDLALPQRGHSFAPSPDNRTAVVFSRRPGRLAIVIDLAHGAAVNTFESPTDRHFYGHGVFSGDGRLLYATENDFRKMRGVIGIYDSRQGYKRIGEIPSHGVGPHEILLLSDGIVLAVANGGIATRPDLRRVKLNLPTMSPSLCRIDRRDGRLLAESRLDPDLHRLSIRHIARDRHDRVAIAMQYEGPRGDLVPLVGLDRGGRLSLLQTPPDVLREMKQYCGSVCFDSSERIIAASAPRGNLVAFWDSGTGSWLSSARVVDGSGIAPAGAAERFVASSGRGGAFAIDARTGQFNPFGSEFVGSGRWDNHLVAVPTP